MYIGDPVVQKDVRYEQACVLFNLGKNLYFGCILSFDTRETSVEPKIEDGALLSKQSTMEFVALDSSRFHYVMLWAGF